MLIKNIFNYLKKKDFYILDFSNKFSIFKILILGKRLNNRKENGNKGKTLYPKLIPLNFNFQ